MKDWPLFGGFIAGLVAASRFGYESLNKITTVVKNLLIIITFLVIASHIAHLVGLPVPDLMKYLPGISQIAQSQHRPFGQ